MSQTPITVTYPLEEVFGEIKQGALKNRCALASLCVAAPPIKRPSLV